MKHSEILGVSQNASKTEIKKAYRKAAKELHPDHSNSPEAAEAFARIKEAHDALIKDSEMPRESTTVSATSARAAATTTQTAYAHQQSTQKMTDEELEHIQNLDEKIRYKRGRKSLFRKVKESAELRRHRNKIRTNEKRIRGEY